MSKPRIGDTAEKVRRSWQVPDEVPDHAVLISADDARKPTRVGFVRLGFFEWEEPVGR